MKVLRRILALVMLYSFSVPQFVYAQSELINGDRVLVGTLNYCADAGSTDAYACNLDPAITTYITGAHYLFKANTANTGAATLNLNGLGAKTIVKVTGGITTTLRDNDIRVGQFVDVVYDGTNLQMQSPSAMVFPDFHYFPAANCVNSVAGVAWSTGATPAGACRAGSNNSEGYLTWGASDTAQVSIGLPLDWDTATNPSVSLQVATTDTTNAHTIIMQIATACGKGDGTTTDDVAFNTAQSFGTVTINTTANQQWKTTLSNITMTNCTAGGLLRLKLSRTTDTATNVRVYGLGITIPRLLTVQAN